MGQKNIFDAEKFKSYAGQSAEEMITMGDLFSMQTEQYVQALSAAVQAHDAETWAETAHKMKGMASFVGADCLYEACRHAEMTCDELKHNGGHMLAEIEREATAATNAVHDHVRQMREE